AAVEPVAGELERRPLAHLELEDLAPEVARGVDVVGEHEEVVEPGHGYAWAGTPPTMRFAAATIFSASGARYPSCTWLPGTGASRRATRAGGALSDSKPCSATVAA